MPALTRLLLCAPLRIRGEPRLDGNDDNQTDEKHEDDCQDSPVLSAQSGGEDPEQQRGKPYDESAGCGVETEQLALIAIVRDTSEQ